MLAIGSFAGASFLSIKALRLYDQLGLLKPSYTDPQSGYRYYGLGQLQHARLIRMLRQMEMPLATIRQVLEADPASAELTVRGYVRALEERTDLARQLVNHVLAHIYEEENPMALNVQVLALDAQPVVSISKRITVAQIEQHIDSSIGALFGYIEQAGGSSAGAPFGIFHGPVNQEEDGPLEVCVPVAAPLAGAGEIVAATLPPTQAASVTMTGDECEFPAILKAYDAASDWIHANGYEISGSPREIWHSPPGPEARMEIAWPFRKKGAAGA
ncbi:MAG TPA: MerR family transcriptional regulator [Herpetosiphonaceae bacterium]